MMEFEGSERERPAWPVAPAAPTIAGADRTMETGMEKDAVLVRLAFLEDLVDLTMGALWKHVRLTRDDLDRIYKVLVARADAMESERRKQLAMHWHGGMLQRYQLGEGVSQEEAWNEWERRFDELRNWVAAP